MGLSSICLVAREGWRNRAAAPHTTEVEATEAVEVEVEATEASSEAAVVVGAAAPHTTTTLSRERRPFKRSRKGGFKPPRQGPH